MTPWIKIRSNLPKDPHVLRLAARLKQPVATVLGALYMLWALADEQTTDGRLVGWDAAMLDAHVGVSGFAEALAAGDKMECRHCNGLGLVTRYGRDESAEISVCLDCKGHGAIRAESVTRIEWRPDTDLSLTPASQQFLNRNNPHA